MKLKTYLADINMTVKAFADLLQINHCYLSRVANGHTKPGRKLARLIEEITDGKVSLLEPEELRPKRLSRVSKQEITNMKLNHVSKKVFII